MNTVVRVRERSTWLEFVWWEDIPPTKVFGVTIWPGSQKKRITRTIRLYPASFGLDPRTATRERVIRLAEKEGYERCPENMVKAAQATALVQRRGYLVFPLEDGSQIVLFANGSGAPLFPDEDLTPTTVENSRGWSIVMVVPDRDWQ